MTGCSSSIKSIRFTAGLMNLHSFNPLTDGTEFRAGGGFNHDQEKQNPGADSGTGSSDTNKRSCTTAAASRRRRQARAGSPPRARSAPRTRTRSAARGTARVGTSNGRATTSDGGPARGTRAAYGITARGAAYGITARSAADGGSAQRTFRTRCRPAFHSAKDGRTAPSIAGRGQSRGCATTGPSAACLAATGPARGPSTYQCTGAIAGSREHAPTVACRA